MQTKMPCTDERELDDNLLDNKGMSLLIPIMLL